MTWPLVTGMSTEIATDLGDPVFVCWVMLWTGGQILRFLQGDWGALADYWNGNIFYPESLTVAYAEHLTPLTLQALPIYVSTGNIVLAYNVVFLSTFVLSGLGMFLLVREWTGRPWAAVFAGMAFAFAPYRMDQLSHVQVISSQWMPFALYGLRRYFASGRLRPLAGAAASLILQILSCGYFLLFFVPFAGLYCAWELWHLRAAGFRQRVWHLTAAWVAVALVVAPFLQPYYRVRERTAVGIRPLAEVVSFSADVSAFLNAPPRLRLWGERLVSYPKHEGAGFPGVTIAVCVGIAAVWWLALAMRRRRDTPPWVAFALFGLVGSALLALGPEIQWHGRTIGPGPYGWLYGYVSGFDGVRVPARFLMITTLFAAILAGAAACVVLSRWPRAGRAILGVGVMAILAESWVSPLGSNQRLWVDHYELAPRHLASATTLGAVYEAVRDLPASTVLAEFPFGAAPFDIQTVFYAGYHRKPVINGYSGFFPPSFARRFETLGWDPTENGGDAWRTLLANGVTHVVVHEAAYRDQKGPRLSTWMRASGARELVAAGTDRLFALK